MRKVEFGDHVQLMQGFYRIAIRHFAIPFRDRTVSQEYRLGHLERKHGHGEITSVMEQIPKCCHLNFQLCSAVIVEYLVKLRVSSDNTVYVSSSRNNLILIPLNPCHDIWVSSRI